MAMVKRIVAMLGIAGSLMLAGCAGRGPPISTITTPPPVAAVTAALPAGATPGMRIPARLSDGSYMTPNRDLSSAAILWHLRTALNVAALGCRGAGQETLVDDYNAMLTARKVLLMKTETQLAAEYRAGGGDWRANYDNAMTRLYNYWSFSPARDGFCQAATMTVGRIAGLPDAALEASATSMLHDVEQPFIAFFQAYDAWRAGQADVQQPAAASGGPVPGTVPSITSQRAE